MKHIFYTIIEKYLWGSFNVLQNCNTFEDYINWVNKYKKNLQIEHIVQLLYIHMINSNYSTQFKYKYIFKIINNKLLSIDNVMYFLKLFNDVQRYYISLNKFAHICKYKMTNYVCKEDLYLNPIEEIHDNTISVIHENQKYIFTIPDITKIICKTLNHSFSLHIDPQPCRNPYNNIPFTKSNLYTIYFKIKQSTFILPSIFQYYFESNFNLHDLIEKYETQLREYAIKYYIENEDIYLSIINMLYDHPYIYNNIHDDFPRNMLIEIFKPYLIYYYRSKYSLHIGFKNENIIYINALLYRFNNYNKDFGKLNNNYNIFEHNNNTQKFNMKYPIFIHPVSNIYYDGHINNKTTIATFVSNYLKHTNNYNLLLFYFNDNIDNDII